MTGRAWAAWLAITIVAAGLAAFVAWSVVWMMVLD